MNIYGLIGSGLFDFVDGATDHTTHAAGVTAETNLVLLAKKISFDTQVSVQQLRRANLAGSLSSGETYVDFAALRVFLDIDAVTRNALAASLMGSVGAVSSGYADITMMEPSKRNRVGALTFDFTHSTLGATPALRTPPNGVLLYDAFRPEGTVEMGIGQETLYRYAFDLPDAQVMQVHESVLPYLTN